MRWTLAFVVTLSVGCGGTPLQPTNTLPAPSPGTTTLTISGRVIEPDGNAPVEGASVCWSPSGEARCTATLGDGTYTLVTDRPTFPPTAQSIRLAPAVSKDGFEWRQSLVPYDGSGRMTWSPGLQRTLQVEAGQALSGTVYPQEGSGVLDEDACEGCKRISIVVRQTGTLTVRLTAGGDLRLVIPVYGQPPLDGPVAVRAGERVTVLIVGSIAATRFELSTSLSTGR